MISGLLRPGVGIGVNTDFAGVGVGVAGVGVGVGVSGVGVGVGTTGVGVGVGTAGVDIFKPFAKMQPSRTTKVRVKKTKVKVP